MVNVITEEGQPIGSREIGIKGVKDITELKTSTIGSGRPEWTHLGSLSTIPGSVGHFGENASRRETDRTNQGDLFKGHVGSQGQSVDLDQRRGSVLQGFRSKHESKLGEELKKMLNGIDHLTNLKSVSPVPDYTTGPALSIRRGSLLQGPQKVSLDQRKGSIPVASSLASRRGTLALGELNSVREHIGKGASVPLLYSNGYNQDTKRDSISRMYSYAPGYRQTQDRRGSMLSGDRPTLIQGYTVKRDSSFGSGNVQVNRMSSCTEGSGSILTGSRSSSMNRLLEGPWARNNWARGRSATGYKVRALARMKKGRRRRQSSMDQTLTSDTEDDTKESLLPRWRFAARIINMGRWMTQDYIKTCDYAGTPYRKQVEQIDQSASLGINRDHSLFFDPSDFKANKQMRMSNEARRILTKRPEFRTEQDIYYAMLALRSVPAIADYPVRMQMRLAQWGSFQSFDAKRIIVRESDPPYAFYFILYGTVVVCILEEDRKEARTVCFLHRGDSFGELAIVNQTARQSTVIAKDYIEMLVISDEAYERIFMVGGSRTINDPDHEQFMRGLKFLEGWPTELLVNDPKTFVFSFFKREAVLTIDTNMSNWIFIVKSGSVNVLKKLVKLKPNVNARSGTISVKSKRREAFTAFKNSQYESYIEKENIIHPLPYGPDDEHDQAIKYITEINIRGIHCQGDEHHTNKDRTSVVTPGNLNSKVTLSIRPHTARFVKGTKKTSGSLSDRSDRPKTSMPDMTPDDKAPTADNKKQRRKSKQHQTTEPKVKVADKVQDENKDPGERRTFLDDLDAAAKQQDHELTEADLNPQFVQVRTLTKGSVFGLETLVFDNQPSMCLVSNGSECILLNKKFYLEHCPPELVRSLRTQISPYPSDEELKGSLLTRLNWDAYKDATLTDVLSRGRPRMENLRK